MLNNKGFTIVELFMSFAFVSILSASLFAVVVNYSTKQEDYSIQARLLSFKSKVTVDIQKDIQSKILEEVVYCVDDDDKIISRCVDFVFKNGDNKRLEIKEEIEEDTVVTVVDGVEYEEKFSYQIPYISYGGIKYSIPDAANIVINNSYLLQNSRPEDGVENGMTLYKVYIDLEHVDLDADIDISIVATGNKFITDGTAAQYGEYKAGDRVQIQLGGEIQDSDDITTTRGKRWFRVLKDSSTYENRLVLLAEFMISESCIAAGGCNLSYGTNVGKIPYSSVDMGNVYNMSDAKLEIEKLSSKYGWNNPDVIRIPSAEELGYLIYACPKYETENAGDISLATAPSWVYSTGNYWTMTPKLYSDPEHADKNVWYVNTSTKKITDSFIEATDIAGIRPVIEIKKDFVLAHEPAS